MPAASVQLGSAATVSGPGSTVRRLIVSWQHPVSRAISPVGELRFDGSRYFFNYIENARTVLDFSPFLGFSSLDRAYESDQLFALFAQRAMAPRRPDYTQWIKRLGLAVDATPFEQIARSGGRREGDTIQLFPVPLIEHGLLKCSFLIHGIHYVASDPLIVDGRDISIGSDQLDAELSSLRVGDKLRLLDQPENLHNNKAILTTTATDVPLGWVPDLLVSDLHRIPDRGAIDVEVEHINSADAGWHLRVLARLSARVPKDFRIFEGGSWRPYGASQ